MRRASVIAAMLAACTRPSKPTAAGCCDKSGPAPTGDGASDMRGPSIDGGATGVPSRFRREEGCARDFKSSGEAVPDIAELQRLCAQGLVALLPEVVTGNASGTEALEVPFRVSTTTACLRAGVVGATAGGGTTGGGTTGGGLLVSLVNERGVVLASASALEPVAVVPVDGTICVREPGAYRVVVRLPAVSEAMAVAVQAWRAGRE